MDKFSAENRPTLSLMVIEYIDGPLIDMRETLRNRSEVKFEAFENLNGQSNQNKGINYEVLRS